jgi:cyclopropane fatty-acyl-phospholipid synthase-like methyltransferase
MATNPVGKGTKTLGINMSKEMCEEIEARAASMHLSSSRYAKLILMDWMESGRQLTLKENYSKKSG